MVQNFQYEILEEQIRECFGRVVWTHKTHEKCADILNKRLSYIKLSQIILSAFITTGILITVFGSSEIIGIFTAVISFILTILNTYSKKDDLGGLAQKHVDAAKKIWNVRENYLSLLVDIKARTLNIDEVIQRRDILQSSLNEIYQSTPRTFSKAYNEATKGLKEAEELTFSDKEIDILLPNSLRKNLYQ